MTAPVSGKDASWLMLHINGVRTAVLIIIAIIGIIGMLLNDYGKSLGIWMDILTCAGFVMLGFFIVFFCVLMHLSRKNIEDSSEQLGEYKQKHTNTFIDD